jgi:large repetitive protein
VGNAHEPNPCEETASALIHRVSIGTQIIDVLVTDAQGAVTTQTYNLVVGTTPINQAPTITSTPKIQVTIGNTCRYDVIAQDPDNDTLTYSLDTAALAAGVTIDKLGWITWKPTTLNIGIQPVTITVTDTIGAGRLA